MSPEPRNRTAFTIVGLLGVIALMVALIWASDRITLQGERVLYAVTCSGGEWRGNVCDGHLEPAQRYAFRASPRRGEVVSWIIGSSAASRTYAGCEVRNRDQWVCPLQTGGGTTAQLEMLKGKTRCSGTAAAASVHIVPKWSWYLYRIHLPLFSSTRTACIAPPAR